MVSARNFFRRPYWNDVMENKKRSIWEHPCTTPCTPWSLMLPRHACAGIGIGQGKASQSDSPGPASLASMSPPPSSWSAQCQRVPPTCEDPQELLGDCLVEWWTRCTFWSAPRALSPWWGIFASQIISFERGKKYVISLLVWMSLPTKPDFDKKYCKLPANGLIFAFSIYLMLVKYRTQNVKKISNEISVLEMTRPPTPSPRVSKIMPFW